MKINFKKTNLMLFNPCTSLDFMPDIQLDGHQLELVDQMRLLGVVIQSDLKWNSNTDSITSKAYKRLWMLRRLKGLGAKQSDLLDLYLKQIRCLLEYAVPVWHSSITFDQKQDIERVQKSALRIILGHEYGSYEDALSKTGLESLEFRRQELCRNFASKSAKDPKHKHWFRPKQKQTTRSKLKYQLVVFRTERLCKSLISYLTNLLNEMQ